MKRFYKDVSVAEGEDGHQVRLDGKPVKTPAGAVLVLPAVALAEAIALEWRAQKKTIEPVTMPLTLLANSAIDRTPLNKGIVIDEIMNYARHDLLCYRAEGPKDLIRAEAEAWDPYIAWAREDLCVKFKVTTGIETVAQDPNSLARLQAMLRLLDPFILTALHHATALAGSAILALALWQGLERADEIWQAAQVDEDYQSDKWGEDAEAVKTRSARRDQWLAAGHFIQALKSATGSGKSK